MPHGVRAFYGYTPEWEIDEKQSKEILLVFQYACAGKTYRDMQKKLPGWNQDKIYYTIQSAAYAGELQYAPREHIYNTASTVYLSSLPIAGRNDRYTVEALFYLCIYSCRFSL